MGDFTLINSGSKIHFVIEWNDHHYSIIKFLIQPQFLQSQNFQSAVPHLKIGVSWVCGENQIVLLDKKIITGEKIIPSGTQDDKGWENRKRDIKIKQLENRGDELTIGIKNNQQILYRYLPRKKPKEWDTQSHFSS